MRYGRYSVNDARHRLGRWGERLAAKHLRAAGYQIVMPNYRCPIGEIDLVTLKEEIWVFVEVKTRRGSAYGLPEEAIIHEKAERLIAIAQHYLHEHGITDVDWRIDLIAIELDQSGRLLRVEQVENAVSGW